MTVYMHLTANDIQRVDFLYDPLYPVFGLIGDPVPHKQHQNQQAGLDMYVNVVNLQSGELCFKKLYENTKGLHFKHTGYSPMYINDFTEKGVYLPFQYFLPKGKDDE